MDFPRSDPWYCLTQCFKQQKPHLLHPYYLSSMWKILKETREYKSFFRALKKFFGLFFIKYFFCFYFKRVIFLQVSVVLFLGSPRPHHLTVNDTNRRRIVLGATRQIFWLFIWALHMLISDSNKRGQFWSLGWDLQYTLPVRKLCTFTRCLQAQALQYVETGFRFSSCD